MFDKLRKAVSKINDQIAAAHPDLMAVPPVSGRSFADIDLGVLSAYLRETVTAIEPMGALGPQATSFLGDKVQQRLRDLGGGPNGELLPGLNERREERLRAEGMSEEQLAMIRSKMHEGAAQRSRDGWDVVFASGHRASVHLAPRGSDDWNAYDALEHRWDRENGTDGQRAQDVPALAAQHHRFHKNVPYEAYEYKGRLIARNATHAAVVHASRVGDLQMVGLATIALRTTEA